MALTSWDQTPEPTERGQSFCRAGYANTLGAATSLRLVYCGRRSGWICTWAGSQLPGHSNDDRSSVAKCVWQLRVERCRLRAASYRWSAGCEPYYPSTEKGT